MQCLNKKEWKILELKITQTRDPKSVLDGQMDRQMIDRWMDRQSGPITRPAFALEAG